MQTIEIEGDLHARDVIRDTKGLPVNLMVRGELVLTSTKPEKGLFVDGILAVRGEVTVLGNPEASR